MKKIKSILSSSDLLRHNLIFFIGSMSIAVLNYIYYPIISRLVSVAEFGEIQAVIALFMQVGILLTAFGYMVTHSTSNTSLEKKDWSPILYLEKIVLFITLFVFSLLVAGSYILQETLQFNSLIPFVLVGGLLVLNVPSTSRSYILQGLKKLKEVSISGVIFAGSKLLISVILLICGFSVVGVMMAYIIAQIFTLLYLKKKTNGIYPNIFQSYRRNKQKTSLHFKKGIIRELRYGIVILILLSAVTLLYSFDVVVAKFFLSPEAAGEYSGISTIAKIIFFVTVSISGVLIATVKMNDSKATSRLILLKSLSILVALGGLITLFFSVFPEFTVHLLLGDSYVHVAYLLPALSVLMLLCSINNLLAVFHIARRNYWSLIGAGLGVVLLFILLLVSSSSFFDIINAYIGANIVTMFVLIFQAVWRDR